MFHVTEESLMAWVDGELPADEAAQVQAAVQADPALQRRAAALRELTQHLRSAFAEDLAAPVPDHLAEMAHGTPALARVLPLPRKAWHQRLDWAHWGGIAAGLLLVVGLGARLMPGPAGDTPQIVQAGDRLQAAGRLAQALEHELASMPQSSDIRLLVSFRDREGHFCRSFSATAGRGLACRDGGHWQIVALAAPAPAERQDLRLASQDWPEAVMQAVERRMAAPALDAEQERAARDARWAR